MAYRRRAPVRRRLAPRRRVARRRAPMRRVMRRRAPIRRRRVGRVTRRYGRRRVMRNKGLRATAGRSGDIYLEHAEFIGDLIPSINGTFKSQVYPINIALQNVFNFASGIAAQYEEWDPQRMQVILKSTSGNSLSAANAALGTMGICPVMNTYMPTAQVNNKVVAESFQDSTSGPPSKSQTLTLKTKNSRNPLDTYFTRTGPVPSGQTTSMTDLCNLIVWSSGLQTTTASPIAELWIRYRVHLKSPRPGAQLGNNVEMAKYNYNQSLTTGTLPTSGNFWGGSGSGLITTFVDALPYNNNAVGGSTVLTTNQYNQMTLQFASAGSTSAFRLPYGLVSGNYLCAMRWSGSVGATQPASAVGISFVNAAALPIFGTQGGSTSFISDGSLGGLTAAQNPSATTIVFAFTVTGPNATCIFTNGAIFPINISSMDLCVTQINGNILSV